jgi:hypothetical protein
MQRAVREGTRSLVRSRSRALGPQNLKAGNTEGSPRRRTIPSPNAGRLEGSPRRPTIPRTIPGLLAQTRENWRAVREGARSLIQSRGTYLGGVTKRYTGGQSTEAHDPSPESGQRKTKAEGSPRRHTIPRQKAAKENKSRGQSEKAHDPSWAVLTERSHNRRTWGPPCRGRVPVPVRAHSSRGGVGALGGEPAPPGARNRLGINRSRPPYEGVPWWRTIRPSCHEGALGGSPGTSPGTCTLTQSTAGSPPAREDEVVANGQGKREHAASTSPQNSGRKVRGRQET